MNKKYPLFKKPNNIKIHCLFKLQFESNMIHLQWNRSLKLFNRKIKVAVY